MSVRLNLVTQRRAATLGLLLGLSAGAACGMPPPRPPGATAVTVAAGRLPSGPAAPERGLPIPSLDVQWTPPTVSAGDMGALQETLAKFNSVAVHGGPRLAGSAWPDRTRNVLGRLSPGTVADARGPTEVSSLLRSGATLPLSRHSGSPGSAPTYDAAGLELDPGWNVDGKAVGDAAALLAIDDASVDAATWRSLPAHAVGGCSDAVKALALGQEQSLAYLEPFLDHADAILWQVYRAELKALLPKFSAELQRFAVKKKRKELDSEKAWEAYQCGVAYRQYVEAFKACGNEASTCAAAPRMFLVGGARIGTAEPSVLVDPRCPELVGRDYVDAMRDLSREAALVVSDHLDPRWVTLADRLGAITAVHDALEDICTPRRRRFADQDLVEARDRLVRIGQTLSSDDLERPRGDWELQPDAFHVPSLGPVQQVARYAPGRGSPSQTARSDAHALRQFVLSRALCRSGHGQLPLVALVVDANTSQPVFIGYYYEEELMCADLPPLSTEAAVSAD